MKTVTLGVATRNQVKNRLAAAFRNERQGAVVTFASIGRLFDVINERRVELLLAMSGAGPMSLREAARRVNRDVKQVHSDVHVLLDARVLDKTEEGNIEFPYDGLHIDVELTPKQRYGSGRR